MATFTDDFARPDGTDLGAGWVEVSGDWSIVSGQLSPGADAGTIIARAAGAVDTNDNYAQVTITVPASASQGVWCRGNTTISNGYLWRSNGSSWDLFAVVSGSFNLIGTYAAALVPGDTARVQAVGTTIKGFVNGIQRVSVTDSSVTTGTYVGLRSDSVSAIRYDLFIGADVVTSVGADLVPASATETAQELTGAKAATVGTAAVTETAQALAGAKVGALGLAASTVTAQTLTGTKTANLGLTLELGAAQTLTGTKRATLTPAVAREEAQPLTGPGPIAPPGVDIDITVRAPHSPWAAGAPRASGWEVGAPC